MEVYGLTDDQKADKLLDLARYGDWKPQLCAHIQRLSVDKDAILQQISYWKMSSASSSTWPKQFDYISKQGWCHNGCKASSNFHQCLHPTSKEIASMQPWQDWNVYTKFGKKAIEKSL